METNKKNVTTFSLTKWDKITMGINFWIDNKRYISPTLSTEIIEIIHLWNGGIPILNIIKKTKKFLLMKKRAK